MVLIHDIPQLANVDGDHQGMSDRGTGGSVACGAEYLAHAEQLFALNQLDDTDATAWNNVAACDAAIEQHMRLQ